MKNLMLYVFFPIGGYWLYQQWDIAQKRKWIIDLLNNEPAAQEIARRMTDDEIKSVYIFLKEYAPVTGDVPQKPMPAALQLEIQKIANKYNIFT